MILQGPDLGCESLPGLGCLAPKNVACDSVVRGEADRTADAGAIGHLVLIMPLPVKQRRPGHARRRRHTLGGSEVFELAELPDPVPGPGQVAIDVTYAGGPS